MLELTPIGELLSQAKTLLTASDTPQLDAELLLAHALNKSRTWLHTWPEKIPTEAQQLHFQQLIERRQQGVPIAHLLEQQSFWTLNLKVTADTLIPRPETELLVETALAAIPTEQPWRIADLGTGSGAIALAIASECPHATLYATDQSAAALAIAEENGHHHQLTNLQFLLGSWFEPLPTEPFDLILSNPPYIAADDPHLSQGDVRFDPGTALTAGADGLDDLRHIIAGAINHLKPGGQLMVEHGYDQGNAVRSLFQQHGYQAITTQRDLAGEERITYGRTAA